MTQIVSDDIKYYEDNYKLCLKFFMNKNFEKSFQLIKDLFAQSSASFERYSLPENTFIKVVVLYLIQIGLILKNSEAFLTSDERQRIVKLVSKDELLSELARIYGNESTVPTEIIYNLYLLYFVCEHHFNVDEDWVLSKFQKAYSTLSLDPGDKFSFKFVELYVLQVLPRYGRFDKAKYVISTSPFFASSVEETNMKLKKIEEEKLKNEKLEKQKAEERKKLEAKLKLKEEQKLKEIEKQKDLTYRSLTEIRSQYESDVKPQCSNDTTYKANLNSIKDRIVFISSLAKGSLKDIYPAVIAIVILVMISTRFINLRNIKLKESLKETFQMAFKISYL